MMRHIFILFSFVVLAGSAGAFLPPDASAREPELRAYRQQLNVNYEKKLVERQAQAIRAYEQTQANVFTPPWMRGEARAAVSLETGSVSPETKKAGGRKNRFLVSFVLLILLGAGAGWARYVTRDADK